MGRDMWSEGYMNAVSTGITTLRALSDCILFAKGGGRPDRIV